MQEWKKKCKRTQNNKSLTERSFWGCFLWGLAIQIQELYVIFPTEEEDPWSRILVCHHLKDGRDGKDGTGGKETDSILRPFIRIYTGRQRNMKIWKHSANHHHDTTYIYDIMSEQTRQIVRFYSKVIGLLTLKVFLFLKAFSLVDEIMFSLG